MLRYRAPVVVIGAALALAGPLLATAGATHTHAGVLPGTGSCVMFPADNVWNADISSAPVNARSAQWLANMNSSTTNLHPDFGPSFGAQPVPYGIPYVVVPSSTPKTSVTFDYANESDAGPYPFTATTPIEGGPNATGDRHALMVDSGTCELYELYNARYAAGGSTAGSGATWSLNSDALRPAGWTSADAAGLPILPGLLRPDEVASGRVTHAIRVTAAVTDQSYVWPARHEAGARVDSTLPPMGARFRLKAGFDMSGFRPDTQVVLTAMEHYGLILADNGSNWYFGGTSDTSWDPALIADMKRVPASAFEAIDESSLMVNPDSGAVRGASRGTPAATDRLAGGTRYGTAAAVAAAAFAQGAANAVVVSGTTYPDALAGAYLAAAVGGPVLLTAPDHVPVELSQALSSLHTKAVYLLGGTAAISNAVAQQLAGQVTVTRLFGPTRYDTMHAVDTAVPASGVGQVGGKPTAILASGASFPDALAASAVAAKSHLPIILTDPHSLSAQAAAVIAQLGIAQIVVMGGDLAVSVPAEQQANAAGAATLVRIAGADRQDTAQQLAAYAVAHFGFSNHEIVLARGDDFADALAGSAYAGAGKPILLTSNPNALSAPTGAYLTRDAAGIALITGLGGALAISDATLAAAASAAAH